MLIPPSFLLYFRLLVCVGNVVGKQFSNQKIVSEGELAETCYASNTTECRTAKNFLRILVDPEDANVEYEPSHLGYEKETSTEIVLSIVAVHGLNPMNAKFHAEATWTQGDKLWLRDFLPNQLPNARIMLFGYNSNIAFQTSIAGVREQALNLLNRLDHKREDVFDRPIIFVAHSLGGIVVKRALVEAKLDDSYRDIRKATYGIAFFGTPHQGGNFATLGDISSSIVRAILRNPDNSFMEALKTDSLFSGTVIDDFRHQLENYHILSFYETLPMGKIGLIVDKKSATLGLAGVRERQIPMDAHHGDVCRFANPDGDDYEQVSFNLVRIVKLAIRASEEQAQNNRAYKGPETKRHPAFIIPYDSNPDFIGRQDILNALQKELEITGTHQKKTALWGLGGVGKSQIAIHYAFWHRKRHRDISIYWIHASDIERFKQGYLAIAQNHNLPGVQDPNVDCLKLVKSWLSSKESGRWLMVIDNSDEDDMFFGTERQNLAPEATPMDQYLPTSSLGAILMTTRNKNIAQKFMRGGSITEVKPMEEADSIELFRRHFKGKNHPQDLVVELVRELDGLPLALAQAAAYMQQNSLTVRGYLKIYKKNDDLLVELLSQDFQAIGRDALLPNAVTTTWMVSFEHIQRIDPQAAELLSATTCLDRREIPFSLIRNEQSGLDRRKSLGLLQAFSLIQINDEKETFWMHKLVHLSIRKWLKSQKRYEDRIINCLRIVSEFFPTNLLDPEGLITCSSYLPHALLALRFAHTLQPSDKSAAYLSAKTARCLVERLEYNEATIYAEQSFQWFMAKGGEGDQETIIALGLLAEIRRLQGKLEESERTLREVLGLCKTHWGTRCAKQFSHLLAGLLHDQGKCEQAEETLRPCLSERENGPDFESLETVHMMTTLVTILMCQKKYKEAKEVAGLAVELGTRVLGDHHLLVLGATNYLCVIERMQEKYTEAESLCRRSVELSRETYGPDHPGTGVFTHNLALVLIVLGKYDEAEDILRRMLEYQEIALGRLHLATLSSLSVLGILFQRQEMFEESDRYYRRTCAGLEAVLGADHPKTLNCVEHHNLMREALTEGRERL